MGRGRLRPDEERRIQKNMPYLLNELDQIDDICAHMYSSNIFTLDDIDEVKHASPNTRKQKADVLLQKLLFGGQGAYDAFLEALREVDCSHIVDRLNSTEAGGAGGDADGSFEVPIRAGAENKTLQEKNLNDIAGALGKNWESLMIRLEVRPNVIDQSKLQHMHSPIMQIFTCLNKWRQKNGCQATAYVMREALVASKDTVGMDWDVIRDIFQNI